MTTETILPNKQTLRVLYDAAIAELNPRRNNSLTTDFYAKVGDAVFKAGCEALSDSVTNTKQLHTVAAPCGSGKTTFAYAFIAAMTRYADKTPTAPYGAVVVVNEREKADETYRDLKALLPGRVAIWTTDHDRGNNKPEKVKQPAARFVRDELKDYPVIVVTHNWYLGVNGHYAREVVRNGVSSYRALTVVDERPDEAPVLSVTLSGAQKVREALAKTRPEIKSYLDALLHRMEQYSYAPANKLFRPGIEIDRAELRAELGWFCTTEAAMVVKAGNADGNNDLASQLFTFAKALVVGEAWVDTDGALAYFSAYRQQLIVDRTAGAFLLDASANVDGVADVVSWRVPTEVPTVEFSNLDVIYVPAHTKKNLRDYLSSAVNQRAYVDWMVDVIKEHLRPGEKGLVVCKKVLFQQDRVPTWPERDGKRDERFNTPKIYTEDYGWDLEGRKLCATWYGTGIGSNNWQDAAVVFLFDDHIPPKRVSICQTQGYRGHRVDEGDLGAMTTLRSHAPGVDNISKGSVLRQTKQMALRGNARNYDENGVCGKQRLVISSDLKRFAPNMKQIFPGANITITGAQGTTWITKVLAVLGNTKERVLTTKEMSRLLDKPWRKLSDHVLKPQFQSAAEAMGWHYVKNLGCKGARFERFGTQEPLGALLA
jgi:hypothetical protein